MLYSCIFQNIQDHTNIGQLLFTMNKVIHVPNWMMNWLIGRSTTYNMVEKAWIEAAMFWTLRFTIVVLINFVQTFVMRIWVCHFSYTLFDKEGRQVPQQMVIEVGDTFKRILEEVDLLTNFCDVNPSFMIRNYPLLQRAN